jgi:hypothetical protein
MRVSQMKPYAVFFFSGARKIVGREALDCADDRAALSEARTLLDKHRSSREVVVWCEARLVGAVRSISG